VAEAAGVSESLVSQIERNRVSPAIDTLLSLADALDLDLEYLFSDFKKERSVKVVRKDARSTSSRPGVLYERLAQIGGEGTGRFGIDAFLITLDAGAKTGHGEYGHPGFELGFVAQGTAELDVGTKTHRLDSGDSASFQADVPHVVRNAGEGQLKMLWVVTPPRGDH
jgi:transcriptional regulator with XRE-family HTH domain